MQPTKARADLWMDLALMAFLIGLDVAARLLPHAPGFMPVAASALFAGRVLRIPALAVMVPLAAMALSGMALAPEGWRVEAVVYAAISVPAIVGMLSRRHNGLGRDRRDHPVLFAVLLRHLELRGLVLRLDVQPRLRRPDPVLRPGAAVPAECGGRRPVLVRGAVRRRLGHPERRHAGPAARGRRATRSTSEA